MSVWQPIETAPKDGTVIEITALEADGTPFEIWPMQWAHIQRNGLFPGKVGMWTAPDGSCTWNDDGVGGGPTHWRPETSNEYRMAEAGFRVSSPKPVQEGGENTGHGHVRPGLCAECSREAAQAGREGGA